MRARVVEVLKRDGLGRVEKLGGGGGPWVRRVACGGRWPGSRFLARVLAAREARALSALAGVAGVPRALVDRELSAAPDAAGAVPDPRDVVLRSWIEGVPLWSAQELPSDFFMHLEHLVRALHRRGVCHNDLHKEQNVLVTPSGLPAVVDFQLASVHRRRGRVFRSRAREDLRHVDKLLRRYVLEGGGPPELARALRSRKRPRRSLLALAWRRLGKPAYELVTRRILGRRDGEPRRAGTGPWPRWTEPLGLSEGGRLQPPGPGLS